MPEWYQQYLQFGDKRILCVLSSDCNGCPCSAVKFQHHLASHGCYKTILEEVKCSKTGSIIHSPKFLLIPHSLNSAFRWILLTGRNHRLHSLEVYSLHLDGYSFWLAIYCKNWPIYCNTFFKMEHKKHLYCLEKYFCHCYWPPSLSLAAIVSQV